MFNTFTRIIRLLHAKEKERSGGGAENGRVIKHPLPTLVLGDEATYNRGKIVTAGQEESIQTHVCSALMREVLGAVRLVCDEVS